MCVYVCVCFCTGSACSFFLQFRFSHRGNLHAASHSVMAVSAGTALSGGIPGRLHSTLLTTGSSLSQNSGDWQEETERQTLNTDYKAPEDPCVCCYSHIDSYPRPQGEDKGASTRTFIILSLHFLPEESTSTFTVFNRRQNSWRDNDWYAH